MIGFQCILDVFLNLKTHKVRTLFTGFGITWAMLILVLLQGGGTGLYNGMIQRFHHFSGYTLSIRGGYTSTHQIHLTEALSDELSNHLTVFEAIMPVFEKKCSIAYGKDVYKSNVLGVRAGYEILNHLELLAGRFFNERDLAEKLPVCILGLNKKKQLFGNESAIGAFIRIEDTVVCVIGILDETILSDNEQIIMPSTLFKGLFPRHAETVDYISARLLPEKNFKKVETKIRSYIAKQLAFDLEDQEALHIKSPLTRAKAFGLLFMVMKGFIWLITLCFLVSGVVGVTNMMLIVLKARIQEIAIRKVMGAQSGHIMAFILLESIVINLISGILGLGIGLTMIKLINICLVPLIKKHGINDFEFEFSILLSALALLMLSGCLAGIIPAKRACLMRPVDALNNK